VSAFKVALIGAVVALVEATVMWIYGEMPPDLNLREDLNWLFEKATTWTVVGWIVAAIWGFGVLSVNETLYPIAYALFASGGALLLRKMVHWSITERPKGKRSVVLVVGTFLISAATIGECLIVYRLQVLHSVLKMEAHMYGLWGPKIPSSEVDLDINNAPGDAIHRLSVIVSTVSKRRVRGISQIVGDECKMYPTNDFTHMRFTVKGIDGRDLTIDAKEDIDKYFKQFGSVQWKLECPSVDKKPPLLFRFELTGDAEGDVLAISGTYEVLQNARVNVDEKVPVTK
jgi:hypothetical protein